jgi:hypothetical protein
MPLHHPVTVTAIQPPLELDHDCFKLLRDLITSARVLVAGRTDGEIQAQSDLIMHVMGIDECTYNATIVAAIKGTPVAVMITTPVEI